MKNQSLKNRIANVKAAAAGPTIADLVRARQEAGISQAVMAKRAGVCAPTIVTFERGLPVRIHTDKVIRDAYALLIKAPGVDGSGELDKEWLKKQTENFLRANSIGVYEKEKIVHFVLSSGVVYEYGRILLLMAGKSID